MKTLPPIRAAISKNVLSLSLPLSLSLSLSFSLSPRIPGPAVHHSVADGLSRHDWNRVEIVRGDGTPRGLCKRLCKLFANRQTLVSFERNFY